MEHKFKLIGAHTVVKNNTWVMLISIIPSTIRAVIGTLTCMSMASNSTSDSNFVIRPYECK